MDSTHVARHAGRIAVTAVFGWLLFGVAPAGASEYVVHACRLPDGRPAPAAGWHSRGEGNVLLQNGCLGGGSLSVLFRPGTLANSQWSGPWGDWYFDAPPDTRVSAYSIYRHVNVHSTSGPPSESSVYHHYTDDWTWQFSRDGCNPAICSQLGHNPAVPRHSANLVRVDDVAERRIGFVIECWRTDTTNGCPSWWRPSFHLYAADVTLEDIHRPVIAGVAGNLAGSLQGTQTVVVRGHDRGSGLQQSRLEVDGALLAQQSFDGVASCKKPFTSPVPCPLSGERRIPLDTSQLSDGAHSLRVVLVDAAGNATASETYGIQVANGGKSCAYGLTARLGAKFRRSRKAHGRARAGGAVAVYGRLRDSKADPIGGATILVLVREQYEPAYHQARAVVTRSNGRFRVVLPASATQRIRLAYCSAGGGAARNLRLVVRAASQITVRPRRLRNGESVTLTGRLRGRHIPSTGKLVEVQAFFRNRWRTISTVRSTPHGLWRFRYRFDGTRGRVAYRFRAYLPREGGYPYSSGASTPVRVVVTGP